MLEMLITIVAILIVVALIFVVTKPDSFRIERSADINALPEDIYPYIADFHRWEAWSPWEKVDPDVQRTYSGADSGVGAIYEWNGNKQIGHGRMEIIETSPTQVGLKIDFISPFEAHNKISFTLESKDEFTTVTQAMYGPSPFISKLMSVFCNMEKMVGPKYEEGLSTLKAIVEQQNN